MEFKPFDKVLVRHGENEWVCAIYSHYAGDDCHYVIGASSTYVQVLPYEGNENLLGTTDSPTPPEPEFKFGDKVEVWNFRGQCFKAVYCQKLSGGKHTPPHEVLRKGARTTDLWKHCRKADW